MCGDLRNDAGSIELATIANDGTILLPITCMMCIDALGILMERAGRIVNITKDVVGLQFSVH